jgi:hypothetical protein
MLVQNPNHFIVYGDWARSEFALDHLDTGQIPAAIATHKISVTFFKNQFADFFEQESLIVPEIKERMLATVKGSKERLPFMKLASFGNLRNVNDCLRYDDNCKSVTGLEFD